MRGNWDILDIPFPVPSPGLIKKKGHRIFLMFPFHYHDTKIGNWDILDKPFPVPSPGFKGRLPGQ